MGPVRSSYKIWKDDFTFLQFLQFRYIWNYWSSGLYPSSGIKTLEHDILESGSVSHYVSWLIRLTQCLYALCYMMGGGGPVIEVSSF
jgi:hypothetical protein